MGRVRWIVGVAVVATSVPAFVVDAGSPARPERIAGSGVTTVTAPVPADATAVVASVTATDALAPGFVSADRCGSAPSGTSSLNHVVGDGPSNLMVARSAGATFCLANHSPVNLIADVQGYFTPLTGAGYEPIAPSRVLDTRTVQQPGSLSITPVQTNPPPGTSAVVLNLAAVGGGRSGYVTADRCSRMQPAPQTHASVLHPALGAVSNLAIVPVDGDGRICLFTLVPVHLVVDVHGFFRTDPTARLAPIAPTRLHDTRTASSSPLLSFTLTRVDTGVAGATAAVVNLAMVDPPVPGYVTADRCSSLVAGPQTAASGNHLPNRTTSNLAVVRLDPDGSFCIVNSSPVHLVVDLQGTFSAAGTDGYVPIDATRALDTRPPGGEPIAVTPIFPDTSCTSVVHIGDSTSVGMISTSILPDPAHRLPAQYRLVGVTDPRMEISGARSILETLRGQENARDVARRIKASGYEGCWVFALGTTDTANLAKEPRGVSRRDRIDLMMSIVGDDPVMWVNTKTTLSTGYWSDPWMQLWNAELRAALDRHPNLRIFDWASVVQRRWFSGDGVHYTPEGYRMRAQLIADALALTYPS